MSARAKRIEDFALIGDGETAALVDREGTIEWLCMPRFDSEACFAALLGNDENGCWRLAPADGWNRVDRRYQQNTLILETLFETDSGSVAIIDFMPMRGKAPDVVRIVEGRSGTVAMRSQLALRFDYGRIHPLVRGDGTGRTIAISGPNAVALDFPVPLAFDDRWFCAEFTVRAGESLGFVMTWFPSYADMPEPVDTEEALRETSDAWRGWADSAKYEGPCRQAVIRSLITLKALIHQPTGGIVAAPTSSLPERPGGGRNWDYRYCWLRDATFTLLALVQAELKGEATAWLKWLRRTLAGVPVDVQPFFTVVGERRMIEWEADWLTGFNGARPVRFGNGAADQLQLDIYGEVIDALQSASMHGIDRDDDSDALMRLLAASLEQRWRDPDAGIWESRGPVAHHCYTKVMCWVAFDRAAKWFENSDPALAGRYAALAEEVHQLVIERAYDEERGTFTRTFGEKGVDAALLRLPLVGFLPVDDPRIVGTVQAIEQDLIRDGLVRRYVPDDVDDGVGGDEGAFLAATFWLVQVYARQGRSEEARSLFDRLAPVANDLGLLAEEAGPEGLLGNFPQALSHVAHIRAAFELLERD